MTFCVDSRAARMLRTRRKTLGRRMGFCTPGMEKQYGYVVVLEIRSLADLVPGRLHPAFTSGSPGISQSKEMDHHLRCIHLFYGYQLEYGSVCHWRTQLAARSGWDGFRNIRRIRDICLGIRPVSVSPERLERGHGPETAVCGDRIALLAVLLPNHQVSTDSCHFR